jgi:DNA polymerase type B, organellar and viral
VAPVAEKPVKRPLKRHQPKLYNKRFGVFDIETDGLGGTYLDAVAEQELGQPVRFTHAADLFDYLVSETPCDDHGKLYSYTWYAHNLGGYDALYLIEPMLDWAEANLTNIETVSQGQKIIGYVIKVDRGDGKLARITLMDSLPLVQTSLAAASKVYAPEFEKQGHCPDHDFTEGGTYDPACPVCYAYLLGDCDALLATMRAVEHQEHSVFGINLKVTGGSAGVELMKRTLPKGEEYWRQSARKEDFLYQCVYGGFVWPGQDTHEHTEVVKRDCTAAYAARAREGVPSGIAAWTKDFIPDLPGFYYVTAYCPEDTFLPVIPNRTKHYDKHTVPLWPTGEWETWVTSSMIQFAELHGYKFLVHKGLVFPHFAHPYDEMMDMLEAMECPVGDTEVTPAIKLGSKIKRNSVIGKSATKRVQERVMLGDAPPGKVPILDAEGNPLPFWVELEETEDAPHIMPHWNAWITAAQRITLQGLIIAAGPGARYGDTDCMAADRETMDRLVAEGIIPVSDRKKYGTWPVEDEWEWFQVGGPKNYTGALLGTGERRSKAKGMRQPRRKDGPEWEQYLADHKATIDGTDRPTMTFESVRGARDLLKNPGASSAPGIKRTRRFSTLEGSSTWRVDQEGKVRPYHLM